MHTDVRWIASPSAFLLAAISACGGSQWPSPEEVDLDTGEHASTGEPPDSGDAETAAEDDTTASSTGTPDPGDTSASSDPGVSTGPSSVCGDGVIDADEACDGGPAQPCDQLDAQYTWGEATCADCQLDTSACQTCQAPALVPCDPQSDDPFHAIELGCADLDGWSAANGVPLLTRNFMSADPDAYRVLRKFGSHMIGNDPAWAPQGGERMLLLGTGAFTSLDVLGTLLMPPGSAKAGHVNQNPEAEDALPPPMRINMAYGSATDTPFRDCDGVGDCSQTLGFQWLPAPYASDIAYLDVEVTVPPGTRGYALDVALFSAHFPEYGETAYNDMAILWTESEAYVGNIAYLLQDGLPRPFSLPALTAAGLMTHDGASDPTLLATGFDGVLGESGGATDWLTVVGPAVPGETLTLALAVFDLDDAVLDSALLVDNFRWRCETCSLGDPVVAGGCGLRPAAR